VYPLFGVWQSVIQVALPNIQKQDLESHKTGGSAPNWPAVQ
jgi:hypothetical protein